jgi:hypothetical protein
MKFKAVSTLFYWGFAPAHSWRGIHSISSQIWLQLMILGDRIKRVKTAPLASTRDQPGRVGATLTRVSVRVRLWAAGSVVGSARCKGRARWAARVENESGRAGWFQGKHPRLVFIPKNLFHFANFFSNSKIHLNSNQIWILNDSNHKNKTIVHHQ